jgi:RHS repeat-associated protein
VEEIETGRHRHSCIDTKTYTYVYDNEDIILEIRSGRDDEDDHEERKHHSRHSKKRNKDDVSKFVHGPGIDEPLAIEQKDRVYFYHADGLGSITALTDMRSRVVQSYEYSAFGVMKRHGGHVKQPYTYTAREWDKETGLYFLRNRYYDPYPGKFMTPDPIGFEGGDVNLYNYVRNNPIMFVDPYGLKWQDTLTQIAAGKIVQPVVAKYVDSPAGQRIITAGISGAAGGAVLGAVTGTPIAGVGAIPSAIGGSIVGSAANMLKQTIKEATGYQEASDKLINDITGNVPGARTDKCHDR